jgi:hypothetical protein
MESPEGYKEWLRARGIEDPSPALLRVFAKKARSNPRSSLVEFLFYIRMDAEADYAGTRRWLSLQGFLDPSPDDLRYFSTKIRRTVVWRASVLLALVVGWFVFLWAAGLKLGILGVVPGLGGLAWGLTQAFGTQLPGRSPGVGGAASVGRADAER